ncbi:hypothetical protein D3C73_1262360 [compost metagenome]
MAVVEARFRAQIEAHPAVVRCFFDLAGDQPVFGERLVQALFGEGVVDQADIIRWHTFADERIEAVEATEPGLAEDAALGSVGIHVFEMLEVRRVFRRFVVKRDGVLWSGAGQSGQQQATSLQEQGTYGFHRSFSEDFNHHALRPRV